MNESASSPKFSLGDVSAMDLSRESMLALSSLTSRFMDPELSANMDGSADTGYNLSYSRVVPPVLQDAFIGFTDIFQSAMERSITALSQSNCTDQSTSFSIYKLYEAMMKDAFDDMLALHNKEEPQDNNNGHQSLGFNNNQFVFETASILVTRGDDQEPTAFSETSLKQPQPHDFSYNESDTREANDTSATSSSLPRARGRRTFVPKETRDFLEKVFSIKRSPNSKERKLIAQKCGLTPLQVRVWFTNKRVRNK